MTYKLSQKSLDLLKGVHPDLVKVLKRAIQITDIDFKVTEGLRTVERQKELVKKGASKTMNSRHLTGHAVDIVPLFDKDGDGKISSAEMYDWPAYHRLAKVVKQAAKDVGVTVEWGGDWKSFKDGPHWQLPFSKYPKNQAVSTLVDSSDEYTLETDTQAHTKAIAAGATGVATSTELGSEPLVKAVEVISTQQGELTSGDWLRMGVALFILGVTVWYAWKKVSAK